MFLFGNGDYTFYRFVGSNQWNNMIDKREQSLLKTVVRIFKNI